MTNLGVGPKVSPVRFKAVRPVALLMATLISAASPCLAAMPGARIPCPMAGCEDAQGASFDSVRPCCCSSPAVPESGGEAILLRASQAAATAAPTFIALSLPLSASVILDSEIEPPTRVPLYLRNLSLLI